MSCPAATLIEGTCAAGRGVACGVMHREFLQLDSVLAGDERGVLMTVHDDPSTVFAFCFGEELPLIDVTAEGAEMRQHYTNCPLWQREKARIAAGADAIFPRPTSRPHAIDTLDVTMGETDDSGRRVVSTAQAAGNTAPALDWLVED